MTATEKAAIVSIRLLAGARLTSAQITSMCGYADRSSACHLMAGVSRVLPVYLDERTKPPVWAIMPDSGR
jgi:hypothetical protein